jgi:hypothetical protein
MTGLHPMETILGGLLVSMISATLGAFFGSRNKVALPECLERRASCTALIDSKLESIEKKIDLIMKLAQSEKTI